MSLHVCWEHMLIYVLSSCLLGAHAYKSHIHTHTYTYLILRPCVEYAASNFLVAKDGCWIPLPFPCKYDKEEIFKIYFKKKVYLNSRLYVVYIDATVFPYRALYLSLGSCFMLLRGGGPSEMEALHITGSAPLKKIS